MDGGETGHSPASPLKSLGPLVPRVVHFGAALVAVGSLQFIAAMIATQLAYPGYSLGGNYISDLGNPSMSPDAWLFNGSIRALGVLAVVGAILLRPAFSRHRIATFGIALVAIAGVGAFLVGTFPEGSPELGGNIHGDVSALTFIASGLGLLFLSAGMLRDTRWDGYRAYTALSGLVTVIAIVVFQSSSDPLLGPGGWERLIVAPILLWAIVAGVHLLRTPAYAPTSQKLAHGS